MQVLVRLHEDVSLGIVGVALHQQQANQVSYKKHEEGYCRTDQMRGGTRTDVLVFYIIYNIERAQRACQEHYGQAEHQHPGVEQGIEAVRGIVPLADDGRQGSLVDEVTLLNHEVGTLEEGGHSSAQQQRAQNAVQHEEPLECGGPQQVAQLVLELIAHGL